MHGCFLLFDVKPGAPCRRTQPSAGVVTQGDTFIGHTHRDTLRRHTADEQTKQADQMHHEQSASLTTGIGAYTGAAIASIACGEQAAVVDANVVRVLARLLKIGDDPSSKAATLRFAAEAAALLSPDRPGDFNQESLSCLFLTKQNLAATLQFAAQAAALLSLHRPATSTRRDFTKAVPLTFMLCNVPS